jgi:predicted LPLAT superfamily acyltransferase
LLNAHVGAWEAAAHVLGERDITVNVVMYEGEVEQVRKLMQSALAGRKFNLIPVTGSFADSVAIMAALRRGEVVAMLGDRAFTGRAVDVDFLGSSARFPVGPYAVAAATGAPLFHVFCGRQGYREYRFYAFPAAQIVKAPRRSRDEQYRECAGEFARHVEWFLQRHPMQWSNFYRFWSKAAARA